MKSRMSFRSRRRVGIGLMLGLLLTLLLGAVSVQAADDDYTYTVRVYGGNKGTVNGADEVVKTGLKAGESVSVSLASTDKKYVVKGLRESGRIDEPLTYANAAPVSLNGEARDRDYVVVYGVEGKTVKYTVNYVDTNGVKRADSEEFYGDVGDVPVVAYKYIEGYFPNTRNLTKIHGLSKNARENVFTFIYQPNPVETVVVTPTPAPDTGNQGQEGTGTQTAESGTGTAESGTGTAESGTGTGESGTGTAEAGTEAAESGTEAAAPAEEAPVVPETENLPASPEEVPELTDIDEGEVPMAAPDDEGGEEDEEAEPSATPAPEEPAPAGGLSGGIIAALAAALVAILAAIMVALKKRGKDSDRL